MRPQPTLTTRSTRFRVAPRDALLTAFYSVVAVPATIWGLRALMGILAVLLLAGPAAADLTVCVNAKKGSLRTETERKPCLVTPKKPGQAPREQRMILGTVTPVAPASPHVFAADGTDLGRFMSYDGGHWWVFAPHGQVIIYRPSDGMMIVDGGEMQGPAGPLFIAPELE